jgi:hypothetical protein
MDVVIPYIGLFQLSSCQDTSNLKSTTGSPALFLVGNLVSESLAVLSVGFRLRSVKESHVIVDITVKAAVVTKRGTGEYMTVSHALKGSLVAFKTKR